MKRIVALFCFILGCGYSVFAQFSECFMPKTLRMDYYHCGDAKSESFYLKEFVEEPHWGGSMVMAVDTVKHGSAIINVFSKSTGKLLYSKGFCTLFHEWQTVPEAKCTQKCYPESLIMPFPKNEVVITISVRGKQNEWVEKYRCDLNPDSYFIRKSTPTDETFDVVYNGHPSKKIDIVFLSDGYVDKNKFKSDCAVFAQELFNYEPFKSRNDDFNIRGVWRKSEHSGVDVPGENLWRNTVLNSNYYTFDIERYLTISDQQLVSDLAANVPYDVMYVLADSKKYGGGGIYNFYGISAAGDAVYASKVFVHEFAHLFAGLGDEYIGTQSYSDFYNSTIEPWEENITNMIDFDRKMWKGMIDKSTPIPTPDTDKYNGKVGVFEGAGYQKTGLFRPMRDCIMKGRTSNSFCPVCTKAITDAINHHTRE